MFVNLFVKAKRSMDYLDTLVFSAIEEPNTSINVKKKQKQLFIGALNIMTEPLLQLSKFSLGVNNFEKNGMN